jgi:peptidoglycan/LPS O-acetylase OafA/YrhL
MMAAIIIHFSGLRESEIRFYSGATIGCPHIVKCPITLKKRAILQSIKYRADIDGLRAIAVLAIIIYHTNSNWLPGGVASLGIFFVISGFLITSIIHNEIQADSFSFTRFYTRRIKRILPLFYFVIFCTSVVSFFLLSPKEYLEYGKSVRYAVIFLANVYFSKEQDYFAPDAEEVPLLHLWTLSVEEQYYLLWPALLLMLRTRLPQYTFAILLLIGILSFTLATYWAADKATSSLSYYSIASRFGEFLIGSMLALYQPKSISRLRANLGAIIGISLIAGSFILLSDDDIYPGFNALWSCIGTALLIYSGTCQQQPIINKILALPAVVFIGLISYSLYLWHWPILAYARYYTMSSELPLAWVIFCLSSTLVLSYFTWRFIEKPAREQKNGFKSAAIKFFLIPSIILLILCFAIKQTDGYLFNDKSEGLDTIESPSLICHNDLKENCHLGKEGTPARTLIIGDSHTAHLTTFFDLLGHKQGWGSNILSVDSCPPLTQFDLQSIGNEKQRLRCKKLIERVSATLDQYDTVIYSLRWDLHFGLNQIPLYSAPANFQSLLEHDIQMLLAKNKTVFITGQVPLYLYNVLRLYRTPSRENSLDLTYEKSNAILQAIDDKYDGVHYIDLSAIIKTWDMGMIKGLPAYKDQNHLNVYGQKMLADQSNQFTWIADIINSK